MSVTDADLEDLARRAGEALAARGLRLVTAESCTGGWIAEAITAIPGSSEWFDRGFVTYSNEAKREMLGVDAATLAAHGAVSEAVVREMARGAVARSAAAVAVAVSGVAGPDGGSREKPVGTVWIGWARRGGETRANAYRYPGDRREIRARAVADALRGVIDLAGVES